MSFNIKKVINTLYKATESGSFYWKKPIENLYPINSTYYIEDSYCANYNDGVFIIALKRNNSHKTIYTLLTKTKSEDNCLPVNRDNEYQDELSELYNLIDEKSNGSYALINALLHDTTLF